MMAQILFAGDVMGAAGRRALRLALARLRQDGCPAARLTRAMQACAAVTTLGTMLPAMHGGGQGRLHPHPPAIPAKPYPVAAGPGSVEFP